MDERTDVAYTMDFTLEYPIFMGIQYGAMIVRPLGGEPLLAEKAIRKNSQPPS